MVVILRILDGEAAPLLDPDISQAEVIIAVFHGGGGEAGLGGGGAGLGGGRLLANLHALTDPLTGRDSS